MNVWGWAFAPSLWPTVVVVLLVPLLAGLGFWQLGRAAHKTELEQLFAARAEAEPVILDADAAGDVDPARDWRYQRIALTGRYLAARQFLLDNRTHQGIAGYHVLTPLQLEGIGQPAVLVNRGWLAVGGYRDRLPALPAPAHSVRLDAVVAGSAGDGLLLGPSGYEQDDWPKVVQRIDVAQMEAALQVELLPFIALLGADQPDGFIRDWKAHAGFGPTRHQGYALQWFSLSVALLVIYVAVNARRAGADEAA